MACSIHDFIDKNCNIFVLKVTKLDKEVIDLGQRSRLWDLGKGLLIAQDLFNNNEIDSGWLLWCHNIIMHLATC